MNQPPIQKGAGGEWDEFDSLEARLDVAPDSRLPDDTMMDESGDLAEWGPMNHEPDFGMSDELDDDDTIPLMDRQDDPVSDDDTTLDPYADGSDSPSGWVPISELEHHQDDQRAMDASLSPASVLGYADVVDWFEPVVLACDTRVPGQGLVFRKCLMAMLAGGHVLLEGVPGVAKTLIADTLGTIMGLSPSCLALTNDLMVSDLVGSVTLDSVRQSEIPHFGPIFSHVFIADGVNRMPSKLAGVLLDAMQSRRVRLHYNPYSLPDPFFVVGILTQDGYESYPMTPALTDRWMMTLFVDYPSIESERAMVTNMIRERDPHPPVLASPLHVIEARRQCESVHVEPSIIDYVVNLVAATRQPGLVGLSHLQPFILRGASPRASVATIQLAKVGARLSGRTYVIPDDIKRCIKDVICPRVQLTFDAFESGMTASTIVDQIMGTHPTL